MMTEIKSPSLGPPALTFVAVAIVVVVLSAPFVPSPGISNAALVVVAALVDVERATARVVLVAAAEVVVGSSVDDVVSSGTVVVDSVVEDNEGRVDPGSVVVVLDWWGAADVARADGSRRMPSAATAVAIKRAAMRPARAAPRVTDVSLAHRGRRQGTTSGNEPDRMAAPGTIAACQSVRS